MRKRLRETNWASKTGAPVKLSRLGEDDRLLLIYQTATPSIHEKGYDATSFLPIQTWTPLRLVMRYRPSLAVRLVMAACI